MLGLYLHVPFCQAICSYCNFNRGLYDEGLKTRYVAALEREIERDGGRQRVDSIFFGGGTPSLLDPAEIARIVASCRAGHDVTADAEVTLETNPETATAERLDAFRAAGITRISFGAQTFDDDQLRRLGRIHDARRIGEAVAAARRAGFDNVSLDLMFWLPGQSRASWLDSVARAADLDPDHLSFYLLELYPNAPLREAMARGQRGAAGADAQAWQQESDDEAADMYLEGLAALDGHGYEQYEISNVARTGRESRHNLKYWTGGSWHGFGCGAHSTVGDLRWQNVAGTVDYIERIEQRRDSRIQVQTLSPRHRMEEALFTGLRLTRGVDRARFAEQHGVDPWIEYNASLSEAAAAGHVWQRAARFGLTRQGMLVANEIFAAFV